MTSVVVVIALTLLRLVIPIGLLLLIGQLIERRSTAPH
jgi:hypothetical protein